MTAISLSVSLCVSSVTDAQLSRLTAPPARAGQGRPPQFPGTDWIGLNWNEHNSQVLLQRFEKAYGIKEGVFETPLAIMKTLNYGFPDLTKTNKVGVVDDDPLNSLLPPGPGLVKVYDQPERQRHLDAEPGRGEIVIEPKRGIKRSASRERTLLETMEKPRKETKTEDKRRGRVTSQGRGD